MESGREGGRRRRAGGKKKEEKRQETDAVASCYLLGFATIFFKKITEWGLIFQGLSTESNMFPIVEQLSLSHLASTDFPF